MLRRVRIGLLLPDGGAGLLPEIRAVVQDELGWDDKRWEEEAADYTRVWRNAYSVPVLPNSGAL
jgi:glycerol-3-phosphate dehydrogenase